jgi:hypothetical protein
MTVVPRRPANGNVRYGTNIEVIRGSMASGDDGFAGVRVTRVTSTPAPAR